MFLVPRGVDGSLPLAWTTKFLACCTCAWHLEFDTLYPRACCIELCCACNGYTHELPFRLQTQPGSYITHFLKRKRSSGYGLTLFLVLFPLG